MEKVEKRCIVEVLRYKYRRGNKRERGRLLTVLMERLGVGRRQARRLLSGPKIPAMWVDLGSTRKPDLKRR
jgi:hypothetical protein